MKFYPCFTARAKAAKQGYAALTEAEKWDHHGDVYGWRRVFQGISVDERSSPIDPAGDWFDAQRADMAERHYRGQIECESNRRRNPYDD